jgi:hypothetical protein
VEKVSHEHPLPPRTPHSRLQLDLSDPWDIGRRPGPDLPTTDIILPGSDFPLWPPLPTVQLVLWSLPRPYDEGGKEGRSLPKPGQTGWPLPDCVLRQLNSPCSPQGHIEVWGKMRGREWGSPDLEEQETRKLLKLESCQVHGIL